MLVHFGATSPQEVLALGGHSITLDTTIIHRALVNNTSSSALESREAFGTP